MRNKVTPPKAFKPKFYVPERVFFCNLFRCCQCEPSVLFDEINETMREDIREYQYAIGCQIDNVAKKDLPLVENEHILPGSFIKFIERKSQQNSQKAGNYVLTKCHRTICEVERSVKQGITKRKYKPANTSEDKEMLKMFEKLYSVSEALSERQFHRILQPFDEAPNASFSEGKTYSADTNHIVRFTIRKVFPKMRTPRGKSFLVSLTSKRWQDIVYMVPAKKRTNIRVISVDDVNRDDFETSMQHHFDKLKKFESDLNMDIEAVGDVLLEMYDEICDHNKDGTIFGLKYNSISTADSSDLNFTEEIQVMIADNEKYKYEMEMSCHILNFLRWIHMPPNENREFMESIDKIIERIQDQVLCKIGSSFTVEEFCSFRKTDCSSDSLFLWCGNADLLYQLIDAMHNEFFVYSTIIEMGGQHE